MTADPTLACGLYDFRYAPYALGDVLTWLVKLMIAAEEGGRDGIEILIHADPAEPASWRQRHITPANHLDHLTRLLPAFLCTDRMRRLTVHRDKPGFLSAVEARRRAGCPSWPAFRDHRRMRLDFISHFQINAFHARHGRLPWLSAPRGMAEWARTYRQTRWGTRPVVATNVRQARLSPVPASLQRDTEPDIWEAFFRAAVKTHPDLVFVLMGGYDEWPHGFQFLDNLFIPRCEGFGLAEELALLRAADLFMGSSSGFSTMATFSPMPYRIFDVEETFAPYAGIAVGDSRYPFARADQVLYWGRESTGLLSSVLDDALAGLAG